jgi:hypothetical protein
MDDDIVLGGAGVTQPFQHCRCPRATPGRIDDKIGGQF